MAMKTRFLPALFCIFIGHHAIAQADIHFTQFYETSILRNPAVVGVADNNYKVLAYYRSQWSSVASPYETMLIDAEYRILVNGAANDFLSFGLLGYNDKAGDIDQKMSAVYPAINYNKSLGRSNNSYISFGFTGGYVQNTFDPSKATFNNQFVGGLFNIANPTGEALPNPKFTTYDVGAGINYNFSAGADDEASYMIGVSGYHFTQPGFSYYTINQNPENIRWNGNAAMIRDLSQSIALQLHVNYSNQGTYNELIGGMLLGWKSFSLKSDPVFEIYAGAMVRYADAIAPVIKMKYKNLSVGVSYDVNMSSLQTATNMQGGFEMTMSVSGNYPKNPAGYRKSVCPRF
jgi:type IX secretion system PorP/SprF family membrane protein